MLSRMQEKVGPLELTPPSSRAEGYSVLTSSYMLDSAMRTHLMVLNSAQPGLRVSV